ncbi:MAG: hypothetical protein JWN78_1300 [Bacteroidota bacterium]|nr:hypothetical protein [Bacteroidota bacterium]
MYNKIKTRIRIFLWIFIVSLIISGLTAFPIQTELIFFHPFWQSDTFVGQSYPGLAHFLENIFIAVTETNKKYPQIFYGTDWLAFAHIVIATAFIGPLRNPVRNIWVVEFGMIACVMVFPLAWICGHIRGIPVYWRLIDCSFGIIGIIPLWYVRKLILRLEISPINN